MCLMIVKFFFYCRHPYNKITIILSISRRAEKRKEGRRKFIEFFISEKVSIILIQSQDKITLLDIFLYKQKVP